MDIGFLKNKSGHILDKAGMGAILNKKGTFFEKKGQNFGKN